MVVEQVPSAIGLVYALALIVVIAYLWYSGRWRQKVGWLILAVTAALGFLAFSPVMPWGFQQLVLRDAEGLGAPLVAGAVGLSVLFLLTLVAGRIFCGYLCPVGAVQELAYHAPVPKVVPRQKTAFVLVRAAFFVVFLVMAFALSTSLLAWFGIRDFFYLLPTVGALVFGVVLLVSTTLYRPFCRLVCPYGLLLSLAGWKSVFRLQRTGACIECKKCERTCPTDEAKRSDGRSECYLCGRCTDACPVAGALQYRRRGGDPQQ
ncbi:MAG: 4Fe-4S binding protein [Methanospirillum sp.]